MKTLVKSLFIFTTIITLSCLVVIYLALQPLPSTVQTNQIDARSAQKSQQLAKRLIRTLKDNEQVRTISIRQHEINGLTALLHRAFPMIHSEIRLSKYGAAAEASIGLPLPSFIKFLNINAYILPSPKGLLIDEITIGDIRLSGDFFLNMVGFAADHFIKEQLVDKTLKMISSVKITEEELTAKFIIDDELLTFSQDKSMFAAIRDDLALFGDVETISFYYQSLSDFAKQQDKRSSIASFVRYMFDLAKTRTSISDDYFAVKENQAAITALVIYFGEDKFEMLVGDVIIREEQNLIVRNRLRKYVTLQSRPDLQKHFIYSMALQLFSSHGASDAIGEFKEFLDTNKGGNGFSFADLQADRAGTRLAMVVTKSEEQAKQAQTILSTVTDQQLLPSIEGLQEGLNEEGFDKQYQNVKSVDYQQTLVEIDTRLKTLPVYQLGWE